jgi:hypothetical protein
MVHSWTFFLLKPLIALVLISIYIKYGVMHILFNAETTDPYGAYFKWESPRP